MYLCPYQSLLPLALVLVPESTTKALPLITQRSLVNFDYSNTTGSTSKSLKPEFSLISKTSGNPPLPHPFDIPISPGSLKPHWFPYPELYAPLSSSSPRNCVKQQFYHFFQCYFTKRIRNTIMGLCLVSDAKANCHWSELVKWGATQLKGKGFRNQPL